MSDFNHVIIEGNLARDPDIKNINGQTLVKMRVCSSEEFGSNDKKKTVYIDCEWWNPNNASNYLKKGKKVLVFGRLKQDEWEKDGVKNTKTLIVVEKLHLRGNKKDDISETNEASDFISELAGELDELPF